MKLKNTRALLKNRPMGDYRNQEGDFDYAENDPSEVVSSDEDVFSNVTVSASDDDLFNSDIVPLENKETYDVEETQVANNVINTMAPVSKVEVIEPAKKSKLPLMIGAGILAYFSFKDS